MDPLARKIVVNGAPSQYDRRRAALAPGYAPVDGRSFSDLLAFAGPFGSLVRFYDLEDRPDGNWSAFFLADPVMVLAAVQALDAGAMESGFTALERRVRAAKSFDAKFPLLRAAFEDVLGLAVRVDSWLRATQQGLADAVLQQLHDLLRAAVDSELRRALRGLKAYDEGAGLARALDRPIGLEYAGFLPLWELGGVSPDGSIYRGGSRAARVDGALPHVAALLHDFLDSLRDLVPFAAAALPPLLASGEEKPHLALYTAFARLFAHAQRQVNTFSERYGRFYSRDVLRGRERGPIPDRTYLTFTLAGDEDVADAAVPSGTLFVAGQDAAGEDILYASDRALRVTAAALAQVRMVRLLRGPLFEPIPVGGAAARPPRVLREVLSSTVDLDAAAGAGDDPPPGFATFGGAAPGLNGPQATRRATLGFAVASPYLLLSGGQRRLTLGVRFEAAHLAERLQALADATGLRPEDAFLGVLDGAFTLDLSTAEGWLRVEGYTATLPPRKAEAGAPAAPWWEFGLQVTLPPAAPPIAPLGADVAAAPDADPDQGANPAPGQPTLKAYLLQQPVTLSGPRGTVLVQPLSLLGDMDVGSVAIETDVTGLTNLALQNTDGAVDTSAPFAVFGAQPVVGSSLQIRHAELFAKTPRSLRIRIRWFNLPQDETGFKGYYRDYVIGPDGKKQPDLFDDTTFHGALGVVGHGTWTIEAPGECPSEPKQDVDVALFRTADAKGCCVAPTPDGKLCPATDLTEFRVCPRPLPPYYSPDQSAIQLTLSRPGYGFGNDLYTLNVLKAVVDELPDGGQCQQTCEQEWAIFNETAQCISKSLDACSDAPDDKYIACVREGVAQCSLDLLEATVTRFLACLWKCGLHMDASVRESLAARARASLQVEPGEGARALREVLSDARGLAGVDWTCWERCLFLCFKMVQGFLRIERCIFGPPASVRELVTCLADDVSWFEATYNEGLQACIEDCARVKKDVRYPNAPYLPQAESVQVDYAAACTLGADGAGAFFHLLPFGGFEARPLSVPPPPLLPRYADDGHLYLGLTSPLAAQTLTLLFRMAGAEEEGGGASLPPVAWSGLLGNDWQPIGPARVLSDTTRGLRGTGIVSLALPALATGTVLPAGAAWLRASAPACAGGFPATLQVLPHAVTATWRDPGSGAGEHLARPLPAHSITSSLDPLPDVGSIDQPAPSFGGRAPEDAQEFEVRLGERLRHKDRAVAGWDHERLVLERFPNVWKVQALAARDTRKGGVPGAVLVVVVPGEDAAEALDPTTPRAPAELLDAVRSYLEGRASGFARIQVVNPVYVHIQVDAEVVFTDDAARGGAARRLDEDLVRYLSPWFYDAARAARGGRYASEPEIAAFVQSRPYVEAVLRIGFHYSPEPDGLDSDWYFLTSAARHRINEPAPPLGRAR